MAGETGEVLALLFAHSPVPQFVARTNGAIVAANPAYGALVGISPAEAVGTVPADVVHPEDLPALLEEGTRLISGEIDVLDLELRIRGAKGAERWCHATCSLATGAGGEHLIVSHLRDITARKRAEAERDASEARFQLLADLLPVGVHQRDQQGRLVYVNPRWREITGLSVDEAVGQDHADLMHADDRSRVIDASVRLATQGGSYHERFRIVRPDDEVRWVSSRAVPIPGPDGRPGGFVGSLEDITASLQAEVELHRLASIAETTSDLVGVVDERGMVVYANPAARAAYGIGELPMPIETFYTRDSIDSFYRDVLPVLLRQGPWSGELDMYAADGTVMRVWQALAAHLGPDGTLQHISAVGRDVTEQKRAAARLAHLATHDVLTGLPNRALLLDELGRAVRDQHLAEGPIAVLFIDLDRFKDVNDQLGHDAGDELLRVVAGRLSSVLRPIDVIARLGGDEFVVLCPNVSERAQAVDLAGRLLRAISGQPVELGDRVLEVTASIGVTFSSGGPGDHAEGLLREADEAMYRAKAQGRARFAVFEDLTDHDA